MNFIIDEILMKKNRSIQLKAAILLMVFSLNTVVGFVCSLGLDIGYNSKHHGVDTATEAVVHIHKDGKKHIHHEKKKSSNNDNSHRQGEEKATKAVVHIHKDGKRHVHHEKKVSHSHDKSDTQDEANNAEKSKKDKDNCCTDKVMNFQQIDKLIPNSVNIIHPVFFTAFVAVYYDLTLLSHTNVVRDIKPFVRNHHPPISDIRIAIQSFQI
jgi:hypothetical protein